MTRTQASSGSPFKNINILWVFIFLQGLVIGWGWETVLSLFGVGTITMFGGLGMSWVVFGVSGRRKGAKATRGEAKEAKRGEGEAKRGEERSTHTSKQSPGWGGSPDLKAGTPP